MGFMGVVVTITLGVCVWVTGWALGIKSFDAFMVTVLFAVIAAVAYVVTPYVRRLTGREPASAD